MPLCARVFLAYVRSGWLCFVLLAWVATAAPQVQPARLLDLSAHFEQGFLNSSDDNWGCYDPKPGHPTDTEKTKFFNDVRPLAQSAEHKFGVAASGLIAMSMLESGYGWTRTAINANNFFGYKFTTAEAAGNRKSWTLDCQPKSDPNNKYVIFKNLDDNVMFVANVLARSKRYADATSKYQTARKKNEPIEEAVNNWVEDIAASGYNPDPQYPKRVEQVLRNYMTPTGNVNLYSASEEIKP